MNTALKVRDDRPSDLFLHRTAVPRSGRVPDLQAEADAFCQLSKVLADDPSAALQQILEIARRLCGAGTAGLSLLRPDSAGQSIVRWEIVSGEMASFAGTLTPRDSSPCGLCLDSGATILVSRPERAFAWMRDTPPPPVEDLIVPLYNNDRQPLGTLWLAHHDHGSHFHADDVRIVEQLAAQMVLALRLVERNRVSQDALALLESQHLAQEEMASRNLQKQRDLRQQAEASEQDARQALKFKDAVIQESHHRIKNSLQMAASLLSSHARSTPSADVRFALLESHGRLLLLANAHQLLYTIADSSDPILISPLLHTLADALRQSFTDHPDRVKLQVTAEAVTLPVDNAIALALLANEAVMNAYKHAFPDRASGEITVDLSRTPDSTLVLRVADSGIGLHTDRKEDGLGLKLIQTFAAQLRGTLTFAEPTAMAGTVITLTIPQ